MKVTDKVVLITGGAGFIGSHLADRVLAEGAKKLFILDNLIMTTEAKVAHLLSDPRVEFVKGDVCDVELVKKLVAQSDIILHDAASKLVVSRDRPRVDLETNIIGMFNILESAKGTDKRIIYASTLSVLGSTAGEGMAEDHPQNPTTLYGISKGTAEKYCLFYHQEFGVRVTVLRYCHVFGPRQDYDGEAGVVSIFLGRVFRGQPPIVHGSGEQIRCFTYVADNVAANLLMLEHDETIGQIYQVASKTRISIKELAEMICAKYAPQLKPVYGDIRPGENLRPIPNTEKIEKLGFRESITFEQGLQKTWEWVQQEMKKAQ